MAQQCDTSRLLLLLVLVGSAHLCRSEISPVPLRTIEEKAVPSLHIESSGFRVTAGDGQFFVQTSASKYTAVDLDGNTHTALDLAMLPSTDSMSTKDLFIADLAKNPRGGVIALVVWSPTPTKTKTGILCFDDDGEYEKTIWLDANFTPTHVAEFSTKGDYLVSGYNEHGTIKVALFNGRGATVLLDVLRYAEKEGPIGSLTSQQTDEIMDQAAREAGTIQMVSGDDDCVYLYDPARGPQVARIQSSGKASEIKLASHVNENTLPLEMLISHGNLYLTEADIASGHSTEAVAELKTFTLSVYDVYNGILNASYRINQAYGATPVAASAREFDFLDAKVLSSGTISFSIVKTQP